MLQRFRRRTSAIRTTPRPNAYIGEFRDEFPDLDYYPRIRELKLELEDEAA